MHVSIQFIDIIVACVDDNLTQLQTQSPLTALQSGFFCGLDWDDAITNCKMRCPSGEVRHVFICSRLLISSSANQFGAFVAYVNKQQSTECPSGEECFAQTPCTEEMGYPEDGGINGTTAEDGDKAECVPFEVTITSDQWPKEISWLVEDTESGEIVVEGTSDVLIPGEAVKYEECVNNRGGCYAFTINGECLCVSMP